MKDVHQDTLEAHRPQQVTTLEAIGFCLDRLYDDDRHSVTDSIVEGLTFEELIGALLLARDMASGDLYFGKDE